MRRHLFLPALACLALLASVRTTPGQPPRRDTGSNPSHILLPEGIGDRDAAEDLLAERLRRSRDLSAVQDVLKQIGAKPEDFLKDPKNWAKAAKLAQEFGKTNNNLLDENLRNVIREAKDKGKLSKEQLEAVERIVPGLKTDSKQPVEEGATPPDPLPGGNPMTPESPPGGQGGEGNPPPPLNGTPQTQPGGAPVPMDDEKPVASLAPQKPARRSEQSGRFGGWLGSLRGDNKLGSEVRNALKGLLGPRTRLGDYTNDLSNDLRSHLPGLKDLQLGKFAREFGHVVPDSLRLQGRDEAESSASLPEFSSELGVGLGVAVVLVVLLSGAGVLVWVLVVRLRWGGGQDGWRLGRWPIQPSAVQTREDVVKAFEYLALLLLGRKVSTSHHLDIASKLGTAQDDLTGRRKNAAEELAHLYEHARYAPPEEQLSEDELATARRDLSFLAGGAAA